MNCDEKGTISCRKCQGYRITKKDKMEMIPFYEVCKKCNGRGEIDWVENAMDKCDEPITQDMLERVAVMNAQNLIKLAQDELMKAGIAATIKMEPIIRYEMEEHRSGLSTIRGGKYIV